MKSGFKRLKVTGQSNFLRCLLFFVGILAAFVLVLAVRARNAPRAASEQGKAVTEQDKAVIRLAVWRYQIQHEQGEVKEYFLETEEKNVPDASPAILAKFRDLHVIVKPASAYRVDTQGIVVDKVTGQHGLICHIRDIPSTMGENNLTVPVSVYCEEDIVGYDYDLKRDTKGWHVESIKPTWAGST